MSRTKLAVLLVVAMAGCTSNNPSGTPDGGGSDGGMDAPPFTNGVSTLAGSSEAGYVDGSRDVARFHNPVGVAYGPDGKLYVADFDNGKIRVVGADGTTGTIVSQNNFERPFAMAFAPDGTLYVVTDNDQTGKGHSGMSGTVWKVDIHAHIATVVANAIGRPRGIAVLTDGRLGLADYQHQVVEVLDPRTGSLTIIAGTWDAKGYADGVGAAARFSTPYGLVQGSDGRLIVCDYDNDRLRSVGLNGTVTTLAGSGKPGYSDGSASAAQFFHPEAITVDAAGHVYLTDTGNYRIRELDGNQVTTVAGDGTAGYLDSDNLLAAEFYGLEGISVKPDGSMLYVADGTRGDDVPFNRVRQVNLAQ